MNASKVSDASHKYHHVGSLVNVGFLKAFQSILTGLRMALIFADFLTGSEC